MVLCHLPGILWNVHKERVYESFIICKKVILTLWPKNATACGYLRALFALSDKFDVSFRDLSNGCCFPSDAGWTTGCQVSCSLTEHYATSAAPRTGTVLHLNNCLPDLKKPNIEPINDDGRGGRVHNNTRKKICTSLYMQWLLWNAGCQLDAYTLQIPATLRHF
jgi:hypothetical protein